MDDNYNPMPFDELAKRMKTGVDASPTDIIYSYYIFLCDRVGLSDGMAKPSKEHADHTYFHLARKLHSMDFHGGVPNDINRGEDGKRLRVWFSQIWSNFKDYSVLTKPHASVLEMLIALADRIDLCLMRGPDDPDRVSEWFWLMLNNLGITKNDFVDLKWTEEKENFVENVIKKMINREYDEDGKGALFPICPKKLKKRNTSLKDLEIWYQMQFWFREYKNQ